MKKLISQQSVFYKNNVNREGKCEDGKSILIS